jgi:predicted ATPase/class 3 adenylate cyclase
VVLFRAVDDAMKCPCCKHENPLPLKFCGECGTRLTIICPFCGEPSAAAQTFCGECGARLLKDAVSVQHVSPESYPPKHLAEKILRSKSTLEGERKQVTVLFADMKGSMELLADRDPEEARKILDAVLERMIDSVHRYEGTVNQVMGDGIMALFGAPLALEDHAVRACYAALAMQPAIRQYSDELRHGQGLPPIQIRIGINSGEVVVGAIGSDLRMEYTAVGQTTHLAARMEQLAAPGTTLFTAATLKFVEGFVAVKAHGPIPVKGMSTPVETYELTGLGMARSRLQAAAARGFTKFVGRSAEFAHMLQALERARAGHGEVIALVGEPGVGKSRLVWEFTQSHRTQDWLILESGSVSHGKASVYRPVTDLFKLYFQIGERDDPRRVREKLIGKLLTLDRQFEPLLSPLLFLLDLPTEDPGWEQLDPPQRRQRILQSCKRLLLRESKEQPLLVVFEDLHWIDNETQAFLDSLVESLPTAHIFLLVNYRPEYEHKWGAKTYYTQLRIDPLSGESAEALLNALLGEDLTLLPLRRLLIERTEGNPLFLEESVRTLVETAALQGGRGAYRLATTTSNIQMPATVQAILAARIDRLDSEDKRLLQTASVIGKDVPHPLLQAIAGLSEEQLRQGLANLQAAEFLYEASLFPDLEYTFKHALTHEVTYTSLLHDQRRALHAKIVEEIEMRGSGRLDEHVERLGHHALRAELWESAAGYLRQAGEKAAFRSANREAVASFEQALGALACLTERRQHLELAIDIRFRIRNCLIQLGDFARMISRLREAEALARNIGDERRLGWVYCYLSSYHAVADTSRDAVEIGLAALQIAEALGDFALLVATRFFLGNAYSRLGGYNEAAAHLLRNVGALNHNLEHEHFGVAGPAAAWSRNSLVWCYAEVGKFAEGMAQGQEALRIARDANHSYALAGTYLHLGYLCVRQGNLPAAIDHLEQGLDIANNHELPFFALRLRASLGHAYVLCNRLPEAESLLPLVVSEAEHRGMILHHSLYLSWFAELHLHSRRFEEALNYATRALDLARQRSEESSQAWVWHLLARVHASLSDEANIEAARCYREALSLAERLQMLPLIAHCYFGLGLLSQKMARDDEARAAISTAAQMFREMNMQFYLKQAEAELQATH